MDWNDRIRAALTTAANSPDEDVVEELAQHARATYETARADGCSHAEADQRVTVQIAAWRDDRAQLTPRVRRPTSVEPPSTLTSSPMSGIVDDVRYALRLVRREPRHALLVVLTMALGIGATTALFTVTYGVLLKPLPWPAADRLVQLKETRGGRPPRFSAFSNSAYLGWREPKASTLDGLATWSFRSLTMTGVGDPDRVSVVASSASLFSVLGVQPLLGRLYRDTDETSKVLVLSEGLWRQRFGSSVSVVDRIVELDRAPYRIIGVLPAESSFPTRQAQAWVPVPVPPASATSLSMFNAIARLRPGVTAQQAEAEGTARGQDAADGGLAATAIFGSRGPIGVTVTPLRDAVTTDVRRPLIVLLAAAGFLLAASAANIASLRLAQMTQRLREMGIRSAVGATTSRVARQLLVENLLLGTIGGTAGLAVAWSLHRALPAMLPVDFPRSADLAINATVVGFAIAVTALTSVAFGMVPVLRARRLDIVPLLGTDSALAGPVGRTRPDTARMVLMGGQVAVACMLLIGASLLARSFVAMLTTDRGYDASGVLMARLWLPASLYSPERSHAIVSRILATLSTMPSVSRAAFTSEMPLTPGGSTAAFTLPSRTADGGLVSVQASPRFVSPHYFSALGFRIIAGRGFTDADTDSSPGAVVVNRTFAQRYLDDQPIGARLPMALGHGDHDARAIVIGVVDDVRYVAPATPVQPEMYYSFTQLKGRLMVPAVNLMVRTAGDPTRLAATVRAAVSDADNSLVADGIATLQDRLWTGLARPRLYAVLIASFAAFSLLLVGVGLFGALSTLVAQRSRELAVRAALGAQRADMIGLVVRQSLIVTAAGVGVGLAGSFAVMQSLASLLYGVTTYDTLTYVAMPLLVLSISLVGCVIPAARAARMDPLHALRG